MQHNKVGKSIVLVLAFVIPGLVFVFLKKFGKNEFEVTPLYTDTLPAALPGCPPVKELPYRIPESVLKSLGWSDSVSLCLLLFSEAPVKRVADVFPQHAVRQLAVIGQVSPDTLIHWKKCFLFVDEQKSLLLVDRDRRVRGHYVNTREDVDRLLTEATIILKNY